MQRPSPHTQHTTILNTSPLVAESSSTEHRHSSPNPRQQNIATRRRILVARTSLLVADSSTPEHGTDIDYELRGRKYDIFLQPVKYSDKRYFSTSYDQPTNRHII
ncbi:unnamed protein product [Heligmosomoides polygyrus]|uniref:Uncharacterized protein n=1 Tax=Heligmosomoides polygyrus TaxID=6339 RepID=A0A183GGT9_HELPZ|nr:unnamed protein product [Heligmosomoides polygyrus]